MRVGPSYSRNGKKAPSQPPLYSLAAVDVVRSSSTVTNPSLYYDLSLPAGAGDEAMDHSVPPRFVVNCNLPTAEPSLFGSSSPSEEDPVINLVFHFVLSPVALAALLSPSSEGAGPAVALLKSWCEKAPADRAFMSRFKAMCVIENIESLGLPSFINKFNGKPVLISKSGSTVRYSEAMETMEPGDAGRCRVVVQNVNVQQ